MIIRPFQSDDLDALYRISLATGLAGGDASHLYEDAKLMGHIYAAPYAVLEPQLGMDPPRPVGALRLRVDLLDPLGQRNRSVVGAGGRDGFARGRLE